MKKFKKLIPAMVMLLIATMLMGTTTYAWFSMNTTVTATGMTVKAQATSTLLIDKASTVNSSGNAIGKLANGASTQDFTATSTGLMPTSTTNGSDWFYAEAATTNNTAAKAASFKTVGTDDLAKYRLATTFYLQTYDASKPTSGTLAETGKKIYVKSITVSHSSTGEADVNLSKSFRVLVVQDSTSAVFCAPTVTTTPTNQGVDSVTAGEASKSAITFATVSGIASGKATITEDAKSTVVSAVNYNQVYTVNVYIYFDGEDPQCFTDNIPATLNDYVVAVEFELAD